MIILSSEAEQARKQLEALQTMMRTIGAAQADSLGAAVGKSFVSAESGALTLIQKGSNQFILGVDLQKAQAGRHRHGISWVFRRLHEIAEAPAEIQVSTQREVTRTGRANGLTRANFETHSIPGRGHFKLSGPVRSVAVTIATWNSHRRENRTRLDIGRSLVHELVIHVWRDIFFYQPALWTNQRAAGLNTQSSHSASKHTGLGFGPERHNLADAEADLIDYYYDLAMGHTIAFGEKDHRGFGRLVRHLGGVMGSRLTKWETTLTTRRRAVAEYSAERARFLAEARLFKQQMAHMRQLESRLSGEAGRPGVQPTLRADIRKPVPKTAAALSREAEIRKVPVRHVVQRGENLSRIAQRYYNNPQLWTTIWNYPQNRKLIGANPNLIHPGWELVIPPNPEGVK